MAANDLKTHTFVRQSFQQFGTELLSYLSRRVANGHEARELAQEVWLRLLRTPRPAEVQEPLAYIYRTAAHVIAEYHLRKNRNPVQVDSGAAERALEHPHHLARGELVDQVAQQTEWERLLATLPVTLRTVLVGKVSLGLTYEEIARKLNLTPGTVERYFERAMTQLRRTRQEEWQ